MIRALPRVALQLWIVLFIIFFGAEVIHLEPGLRVVTQILYGVPLIAWSAWRLRHARDRLDLGVVALVVIFSFVSFSSRDSTESLGALGLATAYAAWFLLMRRAANTDLRGPIVLAVATGLAITLVINAFLLIQEKVASFAALGAARFEGVATFPWESVNALPVLVLVAIPFVAWVERPWVRRALGTAVALSAVVVVPLSLGRAGWLGLATAVVAGVLLLPATHRMTGRIGGQRRALLVGGVGIAGLVGALVVGPRVIAAIGESGRLLLWEQGANLVGRSPLTGMGPGTYSWVRLEAPPVEASMLPVRLIHDVPLQTLVDGGLLLAGGLVATMLIWARAGLKRRDRWSMADRTAIACAVGFLAALSLDDFSYLPAITAIVLTIAAFLAPAARADRPLWPRYVVVVVLGLGALVAAPSIVAVDAARSLAQSARSAMVSEDYALAADQFAAASDLHPQNGGYWLGRGMAAAYTGDTDGAIASYRRAAYASPGDPRSYAALAALDPEADAESLLRMAAGLTMGDPEYAVRLGLVLADRGDLDGATAAWGRAVALRPELMRALPYADGGPSLETVAAAAIEAIHADRRPSAAADDAALWEIALALDELPSNAGPAWLAVDAARRGDMASATRLAGAAVAEAPWLARGYQAQAAVAAFACDQQAELTALENEGLAGDAFGPAPPEPQVRREFVYREASLGPSQPPGARVELPLQRWPWSLIERPDCD